MLRRKVAHIRGVTMMGKQGLPPQGNALGVPGQMNQLEPISQTSVLSEARSDNVGRYENKPQTIGDRFKELIQEQVSI